MQHRCNMVSLAKRAFCSRNAGYSGEKRFDASLVRVHRLCMKSRDVIKKLKADGWVQVAVVGSHHQFKHPTKPGRVTIPHPKADLGVGVLKSIESQAGIRIR